MRALLLALLLPALGGCTVLAVGGAVVSVASTAVGAGVAVTKGAVNVATYPFRDSDEEKEAKRRKEEAEEKQND
ncbi:hypothetical protein [Massilia sp. CF038]|uniref:hypothetical protein n=1 Tax=Massilia sp. CF038 TaxID=1881045 RepID=UPI000916EE10|nr:hypothetical protein [Massilia sp. CF038]SHH22050.1 hypothetical protein SAMN05428948_3377 [Massilia sp. CF038]